MMRGQFSLYFLILYLKLWLRAQIVVYVPPWVLTGVHMSTSSPQVVMSVEGAGGRPCSVQEAKR